MKTIFNIKIDFEKSKGSYLFDKNSNSYFLDFFGMYSSLPLGYNHPIFDHTFEKKVVSLAKIRMANNVFQTDTLEEFIQNFQRTVFPGQLHFACTGALAVESAIKCAMEYRKIKNAMVLGAERSFHGINSWGFLTDRFKATERRMENFPRNDWKNLSLEGIKGYIDSNLGDQVVAVVIEPIQCTAGDIYLNPQDLLEIQELCKRRNICLIMDEIQTGFGTTGSMWYSEKIGLDPDILVFGKKSQICGIVAKEKYSECITSPFLKLGVTFDGELIDALRADYVLKAYRQDGLVEKANRNSQFISSILKDKVSNFRSAGHLVAFDFPNQEKRDMFLKKCVENNFLCNSAGDVSIRMRPNMAVTAEELQHFATLIEKILD